MTDHTLFHLRQDIKHLFNKINALQESIDRVEEKIDQHIAEIDKKDLLRIEMNKIRDSAWDTSFIE